MKFKILLFAALVFALASCQSGAPEATEGEATEAEATDGATEAEAPAAMNTLSEKEKADGWMLLFDGESTDQWKGYCKEGFPEKGWEVVDGILMCKASGQGEAGGGGDIITKEAFGNFELKLEWKISEGGNSGIFYLAREKCGEDGQAIWKSSPEMQILDNEKHPDARLGKDGNRQAGSLYDLIPAKPQNAVPANSGWNEVTILSYDGTIVHTQNGENVVEYHLWTDDWKEMVANSKFKDYQDFIDVAKEGHIGLQDHGNDVWFRNIKIKKL
ncbi:MAG: family 16 glycoside hydrolase [Phaeodactylibacter xiamenensis]|uniref:Glycosyl hydrolase n=1 Tax=Phaeodactylibacter xiamenensis TaxID=1524460 RepID=A0A098S1M5_9BACT|nr:DUF1080 domain-containing protein [Phaeodactylibacter xiamenensis]KGE86030.1 glycosyl hydrolase [Phaeodactylibacter xiamenensis]MCR9055108.1 DUF1080 domain-containing protein [bacterium]